MGLIDSIRRWIDGETTDDLLEEADEHTRPRRVWEEFLVKIAREVEACMQREMFTPPGGPTYIPREYIVYLSSDDDKEWQGDKRRGLEQGLFNVLSERARELAGSMELQAKSFAIELRVDGTLNKGEFRVQPVWDETESGHTMVTVRPASTTTSAAPPATEWAARSSCRIMAPSSSSRSSRISLAESLSGAAGTSTGAVAAFGSGAGATGSGGRLRNRPNAMALSCRL